MRRGAGRIIFAVLAVIGLAACGGARQDANEPSGNFPLQVVSASFPASQRLSEHTHLVIGVRNVGSRPIPDLTVTICNVTCRYPAPVGEGTSVAAFSQCVGQTGPQCLHTAAQEGEANISRPVWVVDRPPGPCRYSCAQGGAGADATADPNSWQRGSPLPPGATTTFDWAVTAVAPGKFVVAWEIAAGQYGKAKAVVANGSSPCGKTPCGTLSVTIGHAPSQSYVNDAGQIVQGQ
jgi:hypothetical protein